MCSLVCYQFRRQLKTMNLVYFFGHSMLVTPHHKFEYIRSSWCVFEAILAFHSGAVCVCECVCAL